MNQYYYLLRSCLHSKCSYLIFYVTSKCNARCKMCFYWKDIDNSQQKKSLSLKEVELIAKNFKYLAYLSITGGEPTLRDDLDKIIYYFYKYSGTRFVNFSTNGFLPEKTTQIVSSVLKQCPGLLLKVSISLDHISDEHDKIRGIEGAFQKAIETFSKLKNLKQNNPNLYLSVTTTLSSFNINDIFEIINYVKKNIQPDSHSLALTRGNTRQSEAKNVSLTQYKKVIDYLKKQPGSKQKLMQNLLMLMMQINYETLKNDRQILPCLAAKKMLTLTDEGFIIPCEMISGIFPGRDFIIGDLRKDNYNINRVLNSPKAKEIARFIKKEKCHCSFECATLWNIIFNPKTYPKILTGLF